MLFVSGGLLMAQDTIKTLIITEAKLDRAEQSYAEITNVGTEAVNLSNFEFGRISPWNGLEDPNVEDRLWPVYCPQPNNQVIVRLPDVTLAPGESYVIAAVSDYTEEAYARDVDKMGYSLDWTDYFVNPRMMKLIDLEVHIKESKTGDPTDSISQSSNRLLNYPSVMETWNGRDVWYIRHHISATDSAVVDQVGGTVIDADNTFPDGGRHAVAGVPAATNTCYLIRKHSVTQGNLTFVQGVDITDSEWIPIPFLFRDNYQERYRGPLWTVGNHVNATLDESTLVSDNPEIDVDFAQKILTVPWGIRNNDSIMYQFHYVPGLAWHYDYAESHEDSAFSSIRTGDVLTVYACGNTLQTGVFALQVLPPADNEARVVPKYPLNGDGFYENVLFTVYEVTDGDPVIDTISEVPFACRVDSLMKYLELPPNAFGWEIVWVDGTERVDLKYGDLLRITAGDGSTVKDYFLKVQDYRPSRQADMSSITWPDIPDWLRGLYGWTGDTIPNFSRGVTNYIVELPADVSGIPGLVGKTLDENAKLEVTRATSLSGSGASRTVTFKSIAENTTTTKEYTVQLNKQKRPDDIQPWAAEPFISQFVWQEQWANAFMEVCNPGTEIIDMSHYMFFFGYNDNPANAILGASGAGDYGSRYNKYIPGRIWPDTAVWEADPGKCIVDGTVSTIVYPGEVFVLTDIRGWGIAYGGGGFGEGNWPAENVGDVHFGKNCPWESPPNNWSALQQWSGARYYLYKIVGEGGDSVRNGTKAANDPDDFMLIDVLGAPGDAAMVIGGRAIQQLEGYTRKPQYYQGKPGIGESFGTDAESSEWTMVNRDYFNSINVWWPMDILRVTDGIGSHFMFEVTVYKSTVSSLVYKVTEGFSMDEEIRGATTGTTVNQFLGNIDKADEGQTLIFKSGGNEITGDAVLTHGDSLVVISADQNNTSRYFIEVTDQGLSDDAVLVSTEYTITLDPATVGGFDLGTTLKDVIEGVTVPAGAAMNVIDADDAYVATKTINLLDTTYVDVLATADIFFEVIAEDGETKITYQLKPNGSASDAYVTSIIYEVDQDRLLIKNIPMGTAVSKFFMNLVPAEGASIVLLDKMGHERALGAVVRDDRLIVTAADGVTTNTYYLTLLDEPANYLAYVVSDVYIVDQEAMEISGSAVTGAVNVGDFMGNLTPAEGATMETQNETGTAKLNTDLLADNDVLQVTAGNGINMVVYSIILDHTGMKESAADGVRIYPNPGNGQFFIEGAETGTRVTVYNTVGVAVKSMIMYSGTEILSLDDQPDGLYFFTIADGEKVIGRYKVIKK